MVEPWARRQAYGAYAGFFAFGATYGGWQARMSALKMQLHVDNQTLGLLLGANTLAELVASWGTGSLVRGLGERGSRSVIGATFPLSIAALAASHDKGQALALMLLIGASGGLFDNLNNTAASVAKDGGARGVMGVAHGIASIGMLAGGGAAAGAERLQLSLFAHQGAVGLALAALSVCGAQLIRRAESTVSSTAEVDGQAQAPTADAQQLASTPVLSRSPVAYRLAAINLASSLAEGALYEWTSIYLRESRKQSASAAAAGYVAVVASMAITRLFVSGHVDSFRLNIVLASAGALAAACMTAALLVQDPFLSSAALCVTGAGLSIVTPRVADEVGNRFQHQRHTAMAWIATGQACGFFSGPPLIGLLAGAFGLERALGLVPALCVTSALIACTSFD